MAEKITTAMKLEGFIEKYADDAVLVDYCEKELEKLANKNAKARERAAAKKEAGNALRDTIETIIEGSDEAVTREDVLAAIEDADELELTVAKVGAQISQLVQLNRVHKTTVKGENGKSKVAYVYGPAVDAE